MGELSKRVKLSLLVNGNGVPDNFKNNSMFFYDKYTKSDPLVLSVGVSDIHPGGFYFLQYLDDSNWMKYSPVFVTDYKKFSNKIVIFAINFNFIPIEIRVVIFNKYISKKDFEKNSYLKVDYKGIYDILRKLGYEYAMMEFDASRIKSSHRIHLEMLSRFLYSQHPKNVYDPKKLTQIWNAKISKRDQRHKEMMLASISDFFDINSEISEKYDVLKDHVSRIKKNMIKYSGK